MAYLFNTLADQSGNDEGKQNIFGGQQSDQGVTSGGSGDAFQKPSAPTAPSSAPTGGTGGAPAGSAGGSKQQAAAYNPASASSSYNLAAQSMKMPTQAFQRAESNLAQGSQQLQEQADAYTRKAQETAKGFGLGEETLQKAAAGEKGAYETTAKRLRQASPGETFQAFGGLKDIPTVQNLRDPSALYRQEAGPGYSAGQSRFDAAMLRRNPAFVKQQQELLARQKALETESRKRAQEETEKARSLLEGEFERTTGDIRGKLGGLREGVVTAAKERELAEEARRAALDPKAIARAEAAKLKQMAQEDLSFAPPGSPQARERELAAALSEDELAGELAQYAQINKDVDWRDLIGAEDASRFNRLAALEGTGDMLQAGQLGGESEFDVMGAYRQLKGKLGKKRQEEEFNRPLPPPPSVVPPIPAAPAALPSPEVSREEGFIFTPTGKVFDSLGNEMRPGEKPIDTQIKELGGIPFIPQAGTYQTYEEPPPPAPKKAVTGSGGGGGKGGRQFSR